MEISIASSVEAAIQELQQFEIFKEYSREKILQLCTDATIVVSSHRDRIINFGDEAHFFGIVLSGAYKLTKPAHSGDDIIVHFSTPGDVIAAFIMAQEHPRFPVCALAMGPSRFLKIPRKNFQTDWKKEPHLILKIQSLLSTRMNHMQDEKVMSKAPLNQKLAALLINLLEKNPKQDDLKIPLPLTRKELADSLGVTSESVIRIMSEWSKQGIIQTTDSQITLLKPDKILEFFKER